MSLAMKIKELRKRKAMTQDDLALKMCCSRMAVAMWETGRQTPSPRNIKKLSSVLGCKVEELTSLF